MTNKRIEKAIKELRVIKFKKIRQYMYMSVYLIEWHFRDIL